PTVFCPSKTGNSAAWPLCHEGTGNPGEVRNDARNRQSRRLEDRRDIARLPRAELDHGGTRLRQNVRKRMGERAIGIEPVGAAIERELRIVRAYFLLERGNVAARDIGRVRDHEIETSLKALRPVARAEDGAAGKPEPRGIRDGD